MSELDEGALEAAEERAKAILPAVLALVEHGIPSDVVELLLRGDGRGGIKPGALAAAITAYLAKAGDGWLPIESAPRDGRKALVYRPLARNSGDEPVAVKRLMETDDHCWDCTVPPGAKPCNPTDGSCHVTHWRPLPPPPKEPTNDR